MEKSGSVYSENVELLSWNRGVGTASKRMRVLCSKALLRGAIILKTQKAIEASWANSNFSKKQTAAAPVIQIRRDLFSRVLRNFVDGKNEI